MSQHYDCLILGGGVIGMSLAYELAGKGRQVTILERGQVGREASWAGAGILPPPLRCNVNDPLDQLRSLSHSLHLEWAERLQQETGLDNGLRECGGLYLATSPGEAAALIGIQSYYEGHGVQATRIAPDELRQLEPALTEAIDADRIRAAIHCPNELQLRNPRHLQALQQACLARRVQILEETNVEGLDCRGDRIATVHTNRGEKTAEAVCIAAGSWSLELLNSLGIPNGVYPVRGQIVLFRCESPPIQRILNEGPRYIVPRDDGRVLVGSTEEEVGFDKQTTDHGVRSLQDFAARLVPALTADRVERAWAGLRPASFDGFPYIGRASGIENLFVASGHYRSGIHLSTGTARVLAECICGEPETVDLRPFAPGRG